MLNIKLNPALLAISAIMYSHTSFANIENGNFETWSGDEPINWTTIDSGIRLSAETNVVKSGNTAAKIDVTTGSQSNTDFRQSVAVEAGNTYDFSVWVYHTEGNVRARLFVDGYQNYSDNNQTQQWQQISHQYTATSNTNIDVGLRFYDVSGFDGNEVVYIDEFLPNQDDDNVTEPPTEPPVAECIDVALTLTTDNYGSETSWQISDAQDNVVLSGGNYQSNAQYAANTCLNAGTYELTVNDSYGDGMCCSYGNGGYSLVQGQTTLASGGSFQYQEVTSFTLSNDSDDTTTPPIDLTGYYTTAQGLTGYNLKSELHDIIKNMSSQSYGAIWQFYELAARDKYFENDNSILDRYSENPNGQDAYNYVAVTDQCGNYNSEADCYNREHSFPKSWFGGKVEPMNSDVHHIFATDGFVNARRGSYPFGVVGSATYVSNNGSKLGSAASSINYSGTVFEPIDAFKGDFARAYFYMATRYENVIGQWQNFSTNGDAVLDGSSDKVFESWVLAMLIDWHNNDPVDQLERDRNQAAFDHQGNRNPFVDYPEFVGLIWQ
jgi:endonuclease I